MCLIKCLIETPGHVLLTLFGFWLTSRYKERFLASLPASRRANADFTRPVFTAAAFYLCAKKQKVISSTTSLDFFPF